MIDKKVIINIAKKIGIKAEAVERDYVMNLILDAFSRCPSTANTFFFKGGCCIHKCFSSFEPGEGKRLDSYFTHGRFSSDIDLTVTREMMDTDALCGAFSEVADYLKEVHGLVIEQFDFPIHQGKQKENCRGIIHFQGPLYNPKFNSPMLKFDLTADERVVFEPFVRPIYHPYSNKGEEVLLVAKTYTLRDVFAEKLRALFERCSPRDVYDMHVLIDHPDLDSIRKIGIGLSILEKFKLKEIPVDLRMAVFDEHRTKEGFSLKENCQESWGKTLSHQLSLTGRKVVTFDNYWNHGRLPEILAFSNECVELAQRHIRVIQNSNPQIDYNKALDNALRKNRTEHTSQFQRAMKRLPEIPISSIISAANQR